jgi:hypothetical protein
MILRGKLDMEDWTYYITMAMLKKEMKKTPL